MSIETRREREKLERIASIKASAWKIFLKEGLHKSKISEIAKDCSLGLSTLYYYFKDKRQLVYSLMLDYKREKHNIHLQLIADHVTKKEFIHGYIDSYMREMDHFRFFVLADSYYNFHGEYDLSDPVIQEYDEITLQNGEQIIHALSKGSSLEVKKKVQVIDSMIIGFLRRYVLLPEKNQPHSLRAIEEMLENFEDSVFAAFEAAGVDLNQEL